MFRVCLDPRRSLGKTPLRRVSKYERKLMQQVKKLRKQIDREDGLESARVKHLRSQLRLQQKQVLEEKQELRRFQKLYNRQQEIIDRQDNIIRRQEKLIRDGEAMIANLEQHAYGHAAAGAAGAAPAPPLLQPPPPPLDARGGPLAPVPAVAVVPVETDVEDEWSDDDCYIVEVQVPHPRCVRD